MRADSSESVTEAPSVPEFTSKELHERFDGELGKGMTGIVYSLKGYPGLAVKEIQLSGLGKISVDALRLELATVPGLSHPGIIKYHQVIWDDDLVYVVMDRRDKTLERLIIEYKRKRIPIPIELVLSAMKQVAAALAYLHGLSGANTRGLVHRDLKPANVLVSEDGGHFVIADFGLCKDALRSGSTFAGTWLYMAPETLVRNKTSPASDVWGLGVILYELATLKRPDFLEGREPAEVFVNGWKPDLSGVTDGFIRHVLEKIFVLDPAERPTASELSELLRASDASPRELMVLISVLSDRCKALTADVGALKEALAHTSSRNEALEKTVAALKGDIEAKFVKMAAFERELNSRATETTSLKGTVTAQATNIDGLKKDADAKSSKINVIEKELASKAEEIASLRKDLEAKTAKIGTLEKTVSTQATNIDGLTKDLEAKAATITTLEGRCREHLAATKALEAKVMQLSDAVATTNLHELLLLPRLMRAAHMNSTETVRMLVNEEAGISQRDEQGMTALMHAAQQGHVDSVKLLVEKEKGLHDKNGWTALMHAAYNNHPEVVEILAPHEHGKRDNNNQTALMMTAENGNAEIASLLASHEKGLTDNEGRTALMIAVANSHVEAARAIAEHEHGSRDSRGRTALMVAARKGSSQLVQALVEHEKGLEDGDGCTALVHAARAGHRDVAELLMTHEKDATDWTMLMYGAALGDTDLASRHLGEKGKKDKQGQTALILAAQNGRDEAVKLLMKHENGVSGWTNLIYSAYLGDIDAIKENLHEKGCTDITGMTALMHAAQKGSLEAVKALVEHEKGVKDKDGDTAFMYALKHKHTSTAMLLRNHEAPSWTALMCASFTGDIGAVKENLHEKGRQDDAGMSALMWAAQRGHKEAVRALVEHEKGLKDKGNHNALHYALEGGHLDLAKVLVDHRDPADIALIRAAAKGDAEMVKLLIPVQKGTKDDDGSTAPAHVSRNEHTDTAVVPDKRGDSSWTPLMHAAATGDIEAVKRHLSEKDKQNSDGDTVLIIAARAGHKDIVELLDPTDENGFTALMRAAQRNDPAAAEALLPLQGGMQTTGEVGIFGWYSSKRTALMVAALKGHTGVARLLVEREGGMSDSNGWTALIVAAQGGHTEVARLLLEREGGMSASSGYTALMGAAVKGHTEVARLLVEKEGGMSDRYGKTALMWAAETGHPDCARLLLEREKHMRNKWGDTAFTYAKRHNHPSVVSLLSE